MKFILPCIAAIAIASLVGTKTFKSNIDDCNCLLLANVEALSKYETSTSIICNGNNNKSCKFRCGQCGTSITGTGKLEGTHSCTKI